MLQNKLSLLASGNDKVFVLNKMPMKTSQRVSVHVLLIEPFVRGLFSLKSLKVTMLLINNTISYL